jgi:hypothetical protein
MCQVPQRVARLRWMVVCVVALSTVVPAATPARAGYTAARFNPAELVLKPSDLRPIEIAGTKGGRDRDDGLLGMVYGVSEPKAVRARLKQGRLSRYEVEFKFKWGKIESSATVYENSADASAALRQQAISCRADPPATSRVKTTLKLASQTIACFVLRLEFGLYSIRWVDRNVLASVSIWEDQVYNYGQAPSLARKQARRIQQVLSGRR